VRCRGHRGQREGTGQNTQCVQSSVSDKHTYPRGAGRSAWGAGPGTEHDRFVEYDLHGCRGTAAQREGYPVQEEDVAKLSPLQCGHINMQGRYSFTVPESVSRGELRAFNNKAMI
jgi:hypothetical protein